MNRLFASLCLIFSLAAAELVRPLSCACAYSEMRVKPRNRTGAAKWRKSSTC
ncbi:hypothetical protein LMG29542_04300 [Paraburkholderia humisilvae]|uniref:Uncharacterized protein n=1 Tax=Paraburkholderia humisilvae TaxID=627669 RepID=A0A6J5E6W6_9BURK|nr:hypothetical protein LMG29542_04300 [Paraburkholderia humisilvae]